MEFVCGGRRLHTNRDLCPPLDLQPAFQPNIAGLLRAMLGMTADLRPPLESDATVKFWLSWVPGWPEERVLRLFGRQSAWDG